MPTNFNSPGEAVTLTAPSGGVVSGTGYKIGRLFVVAQTTQAVNEAFVGATVGVWSLPKVNLEPWTEGMLVWWNTASALATSVSTTSMLIGVATANYASGTATGLVRLNGVGQWLNQ